MTPPQAGAVLRKRDVEELLDRFDDDPVETELVQGLEHLDELVAEPVLERDAPAIDPARHEQHLLVLDVHALDLADALGEREHLRLAERGGGEPPTVLLPDHGRIQALLDRGPDRERGCEVVALDLEARTVTNAHLVDLAEQVVGRKAGEHVGGSRLDADADQGQRTSILPQVRHRELVVTELLADLLVRTLGVGFGERHRHVHVVHARLEGTEEDRHHEARIGGVQDDVAIVRTGRVGHLGRIGRVDPRRGEPAAGTVAIDDALRLRLVDVGEHDVLVEVAPGGDRGERRPDPTAADHQDPHVGISLRAPVQRW